MGVSYKPKWQISVHFNIHQLVRPEARKMYPFSRGAAPHRGHYREYWLPPPPPPPAPLFLGFGHVISAVRLKKVPNKNARLIEPRIQSSSSILPTWWGNRHIAPNRGTAGLLGRNWICLLFPIGFRRFSRHRGINLFVNNTDYIKSKLIIDNYQRKDRLIIYDRLLEKRLYHNSTRK